MAEFSEVMYTLTDWAVAYYDIVNDLYGIPSTPEFGQMLDVEPEHDTDKLRGFGAYRRLLSVEVGVKLSIKNGAIDVTSLAVLTGDNTLTSGSTPNQVRTLKGIAGGSGLPYFGIIGVGATDDGGLVVVGLPICKLDKKPNWTFNGEENKFNIPEAEGYGVPYNSSGVDYLEHVEMYETASDWTMPTDGTEFAAFFSGVRSAS